MALHIDYYASLNSPWTHLGAARIEALAAQHGAVHAHLAGRFRHHLRRLRRPAAAQAQPAAPGLPAAGTGALARGDGIPIKTHPKYFPSSEALSSACVIGLRETQGDAPAIRLAHRVLKAVWEDELNPADRDVLAGLIGECGLDADGRAGAGRRSALGGDAGGGYRGGAGPRRLRRADLCHRRGHLLGPGPAGIRRQAAGEGARGPPCRRRRRDLRPASLHSPDSTGASDAQPSPGGLP